MRAEREALELGLTRLLGAPSCRPERAGAGRAPGGDLVVDPELRVRIEGLLRVAATLHRLAGPEPSVATDLRIKAAIRGRAARAPAVRSEPGLMWRRPALALALAVGANAAAVASVFAAGDALPSSPLYPIRTAREQVQLFLATNAGERAQLHMQFAMERTTQLEALVKQSTRDTKDVHKLLDDIHLDADQATAEIESSPPQAAVEVEQTAAQIDQQLEEVSTNADLTPAESQQLADTTQAVESDAAQAEAVAQQPAEPLPTPEGTPSMQPTEQPTLQPTPQPTDQPTLVPQATDELTQQPTPASQPTDQPTAQPTDQPTAQPTDQPTAQPAATVQSETTPVPTIEATPSP